ncbi:VOC family protein [Microbacterium sp. X-17]|uniref:VOC family protein n=1 Tax=Microbacterium sp. X-17 TaxID=3144404 RepID=UPI0031F5A254
MTSPGSKAIAELVHHRKQLGLVGIHPYQAAYVTNDLAHAIAGYRRIFGEFDFAVAESTAQIRVPQGDVTMHLRVALAYVGDLMIEIIEPLSDPTRFYADAVPAVGSGIALHHMAYLLEPSADWDRFRETLETERVAFEMSGDPKVVYLDTRAELGHYLEYAQYSQALTDRIETHIPHNN